MKIDRGTLRALAVAAQLGTSIAASLGLAMGGGFLLDRWLGTEPVFLLLGIVVGLGAVYYTLRDLSVQFGKSQGGERS
ncbi:MAG: AtpZ/AtpI family protein [Anaerolineae bacterium]|nr:AtpZ/AtpI family protein [Anaerolineae bacterium]